VAVGQSQEADMLVRVNNLPSGLGRRIKDYYNVISDSRILRRDDPTLLGLSPQLRQDMLLYLYMDLLQNVPFFADKSLNFMADVIQVLDMLVFPPGEFVITEVRL
jgi:hypothetical protein